MIIKNCIYFLILFQSFLVNAEVELTQLAMELTDAEYQSVKTVDLDGDGDVDVFASSGNKYKWYENQGEQLLLHDFEIDTEDDLRLIETGSPTIDFWSFTFDDSSNLTVYGYFEISDYEKVELFTINSKPDSYFYPYQGEFNGDEKFDFLLTENLYAPINGFYETKYHYQYNDGTNQFNIKTAVDNQLIHESTTDLGIPKIVDMNNDGRDDFVYFNHLSADTGVLRYHKSTENNDYQLITILDGVRYSETTPLKYMARGHDGMLDLFSFSNATTWYEQVNDSFIEREFQLDPLPSDAQMFFDDYDSDGDFDLLVMPGRLKGGDVFIHPFEGGQFNDAIVAGNVSNQQYGFHSLSAQGQSKLSYVAINKHKNFKNRLYHYQFNEGELVAKQISMEFIEFSGSETGDINGNGLLDVISFDRYSNKIIATYQTSLYTFSSEVLITLDNFPQALKLHDENQDGMLDLIIVVSSDSNSYLQVYLNNGGLFTLTESRPLDSHISEYSAVTDLLDINNDGRVDITVSDQFGISLEVHINLQDGVIKQGLFHQDPINESELSYIFKDIDNDGDLDVVYSYLYFCQFTCWSEKLYRYFDSMNNSFSDPQDILTSRVYYDSIFVENISGDGQVEIILNEYNPRASTVERDVLTYQNNAWIQVSDVLNSDRNLSRPHDYNGDGVIDFMFWDGSLGGYVFYNSTEGFEWEVEYTNSVDHGLHNLMGTVDLDENGKVDFVSSYFPSSDTGETLVFSLQGELFDVSGSNLVSVNSNKLWALLFLIAGVCYFSLRQFRFMVRH